MDVLLLSRLQFAAATFFHFLFVPLTLGLSLIVAILQTRYYKTGDDQYKRMTKFWGKLFLINFAIGVVTGITLEFQFGTNWSGYSQFVGDIFGSILAIEATVAFFLESTFIAVWIFGWNRISPRLHLISIWLVAIAGNVSAYWILAANAFMQNPVGYVMMDGRAELADFWAVITQPYALHQVIHTLSGAYILAAFFVMGISAWHMVRKNQVEAFLKSFRIAMVFALVFSVLAVFQGHLNGGKVASHQPTKLAAMEALWETTTWAPMHIIALPDPLGGEENLIEALPIPGFLSFLAYHDLSAEVKGLKDFPKEDRPPVFIVFSAFRVMIGLGMIFLILSIWIWVRRNKLMESPRLLRILPWCIPLPYLALEAGWVVAEVGRQPWIVWGLMRTSDAVSPIHISQVGTTLAAFIIVYGLLGIAAFFLIFKHARKGPQPPANEVREGGEAC